MCCSLLECEISSPFWVRVSKASLKLDFFFFPLNILCLVLLYQYFLSADLQVFLKVISLKISRITLSTIENRIIFHLMYESHYPSVVIETKFIFKICILNSEQMSE